MQHETHNLNNMDNLNHHNSTALERSVINNSPSAQTGFTCSSLILSRDARKPVFGISDQVRHKSTYTVTEAD